MVGEETMVITKKEPGENTQARLALELAYAALKEAGHNPTQQLVGYLLSGDPTYITSRHDARKIMAGIDRDDLVEELVRSFVTHRGR